MTKKWFLVVQFIHPDEETQDRKLVYELEEDSQTDVLREVIDGMDLSEDENYSCYLKLLDPDKVRLANKLNPKYCATKYILSEELTLDYEQWEKARNCPICVNNGYYVSFCDRESFGIDVTCTHCLEK
jgi:hypothetical protein